MLEVGQCQWGDRKIVFTLYMQHSATGDQYLEEGTGCEQFREPGCSQEHLLKVVEQQQQVLVSLSRFQEGEQRLIAALFESEFLSDGGNYQAGLVDGAQRDEASTV